MTLLKVFINITKIFKQEWKRIRIIKENPWRYFFYWEPVQSDKIMTKKVDDATKNSLKISKLFSCLLSNGLVPPIYNEYIWFAAHVKTKTKEAYSLGA
jgi:hypothetical protein